MHQRICCRNDAHSIDGDKIMSWLFPLVLLLLALCGTPLFVIIAASAMWGFTQDGTDLQVMAINIYQLAEMPVLIAIPLFTFAGYLDRKSTRLNSSHVRIS